MTNPQPDPQWFHGKFPIQSTREKTVADSRTSQFYTPAGHQPPAEIPVPVLSKKLQRMIFEETPLIGQLPGLLPKIHPKLGITSTIWKAMCLAADLRKLDKEALLGCIKEGPGQEEFLKNLARYYKYSHPCGRWGPGQRDILNMPVMLSRKTYESVSNLCKENIMHHHGKN